MAANNVSRFDVIVVGSGVNGCAAAYSLVKRGKKVLLLDQFPIPHTRGESHGHSRTFRVSYKKHVYAKMSLDSIEKWRVLEEEAKQALFIQNGMCQIFPAGSDEQTQCVKVLDELGVSYSVLSAQQLNEKLPILNVPNGHAGIVDNSAGTLIAGKSVLAFLKVYEELGGTVRDAEQVVSISPGNPLKIITRKGEYYGDAAIIAAGPWTNDLAQLVGLKLPLTTIGVHIHYWKVAEPGLASILRLPVIQYREPCQVYAMSEYEYPGMIKICNNRGSETHPDSRVDLPDYTSSAEFARTFFRGVAPDPSITEQCMYTWTADGGFIIDRHPKFSNIIFGVFAGHGFKMAPANGGIMADLALGEDPVYDVSSFKMTRFSDILM